MTSHDPMVYILRALRLARRPVRVAAGETYAMQVGLCQLTLDLRQA